MTSGQGAFFQSNLGLLGGYLTFDGAVVKDIDGGVTGSLEIAQAFAGTAPPFMAVAVLP